MGTPRKINAILLNIKINRPKLVNECTYKLATYWQNFAEIYLAWVKILQKVLGGYFLWLILYTYQHAARLLTIRAVHDCKSIVCELWCGGGQVLQNETSLFTKNKWWHRKEKQNTINNLRNNLNFNLARYKKHAAKRPCDCCVGQFWPNVTWDTIFWGHYRSIFNPFNHCDVIYLQSYRSQRNNAK